eukprot:gene12247-16419_t
MRFFSAVYLLLTLWNLVISENNVVEIKLNADHFNKQRKLSKAEQLIKSKSKKTERLSKVIEFVSTTFQSTAPIPFTLQPQKDSRPHNASATHVAMTTAMDTTYISRDAVNYAGTLRKTGYYGDIIIAVLPNSKREFLQKLHEYNVIIYSIDLTCTGNAGAILCALPNQPINQMSLGIIRHYLYEIWCLKYSNRDIQMIVSDFRDVFFQVNPFKYHSTEWSPPLYQLVVFQEAHPNRVINRCGVNSGWILNCYGQHGLKLIGSNTISSSGVVLGTRDAIIAYSYLILEQLDIRVRFVGQNVTAEEKYSQSHCMSNGVDQGFHNWLLYTNTFQKYMDVKIYQQGEGPVNTLGGFHGEKKLLRASLADWKILRGEAPFKYVYNWNGELSSIVHQLDRYLLSDIAGGYKSNMAVFQHLS